MAKGDKKVLANSRQVGGSHYRGQGNCPHCGKELQHWDIAWTFDFDFFQYILTKWIFRWKRKGGIEDLKKARHALDKYIEVISDDGSEPDERYVNQ